MCCHYTRGPPETWPFPGDPLKAGAGSGPRGEGADPEDAPDARLRWACRLAEQAAEQGSHVYLQTAGQAEVQRLDELLWTYNDRSFLPHEIFSGSPASHARVRVLLGEAVFKQKGLLEVWVTDDPVHMPVLMKSQVLVGAIAAVLVDFRLGDGTPAPPAMVQNTR